MHGDVLDFREVLIFLFAAGIFVPLFRRFGISSVFGFLLAGLAVGPYGLAVFADKFPWLHQIVIDDAEGVRALAELGVVFLLFMIGLEISIDRLWSMRRMVFGLGGVQILITAMVIAAIASLFENSLAASVVLGFGFALSSTAVVMQLLTENGRLGSPTGRSSFAILLCQDLAVLPILLLVSAFAAQSETSVTAAFAIAIGQALLAIATIIVVGRLLIRPLLRFYGSSANREMFLALVLLIVIGISIGTQLAGLSMALGAFLSGLLLAETEYRHEIAVDIEPVKGLLLGLFFMSIGMSINLGKILDSPLWIMMSVIGLFATKVPIIYALARVFGNSRVVSLEAGLLLGQGGEFGFIIVALAFGLNLMPYDTAQFMLIVTGLSMAATPFVAHYARILANRIEQAGHEFGEIADGLDKDASGHLILVGFGRVGQTVGTILDEQEIPYIGIDNDTGIVSSFRSRGAEIYFGDAGNPEIMKKLRIESASGLVITVNDADAAERIAAIAKRLRDDLPIFARAKDLAHAERLATIGAAHIVRETVEASLQIGELVLRGSGIPQEAARRIIDQRRSIEYDDDINPD